jgi:hypothetical protein
LSYSDRPIGFYIDDKGQTFTLVKKLDGSLWWGGARPAKEYRDDLRKALDAMDADPRDFDVI